MQVILLTDVNKLGKKGDVAKVSDGYARNYLLPKKLAVIAEDSNLKDLDQKKKDNDKKEDRFFQSKLELGKLIKSKNLTIKAKSGDQGRLFGSITAKDIADAIKKEYKADIDKRKVELPVSIKKTGIHKAFIKLHQKINIEIDVEIIKE